MQKEKKEEIEHQKRNKAIYEFVTSDGWKHVKAQLLQKIEDLQSVMNIDSQDPQKVVLEIATRRNTIELLIEWLGEVEGQVAQYESNEMDPEKGELMHIQRVEEE